MLIWKVKNSTSRSESTGRCPSPLKIEDSCGERKRTGEPEPSSWTDCSWPLLTAGCLQMVMKHCRKDMMTQILRWIFCYYHQHSTLLLVSVFFCIFLKVSETAGRGDVLNSTTNFSPSPQKNHSDLRYQTYFLLLFVGVDRACLSDYTLHKAAYSICILLVWVSFNTTGKNNS